MYRMRASLVVVALVVAALYPLITPGTAAHASCYQSSCNGVTPGNGQCTDGSPKTIDFPWSSGGTTGEVTLMHSDNCGAYWSRVRVAQGNNIILYGKILQCYPPSIGPAIQFAGHTGSASYVYDSPMMGDVYGSVDALGGANYSGSGSAESGCYPT